MMLMFLASIYCILLYFELPSWRRLILAGTITGIALLLRPLVVFALFCAFLALFIYKRRNGSRVLYSQVLVFFALSLIFPAAFYGYGIFVGKFLQAQADLSFRPYLLPRLEFWKGWFSNAVSVPGRTAIVFAIIGFFLLRNSSARILVIGLTAGYLIFGLVFTYHIYSHPYYQIQLFPTVAICASAFLVAVDLKVPFPFEVLARLVDDSDFDEFKPLYGTNLVTGWARLHGRDIGVLANDQGVLFSEEAQKAAQFIQLANQVDTPLLFVQNVTGYMVGKRYEQAGIIKHGSLMVNAVSNSAVPHLTLQVGGSYGAGNYGMSGRAYRPRFLFLWSNAKTAVMGPEQLAGTLSIVARAAAAAAGKPFDEEADAKRRAAIEAQIERESLAAFTRR